MPFPSERCSFVAGVTLSQTLCHKTIQKVFKPITKSIQTHDLTSLAIQAVHDNCDNLLGKLSETTALFEKIMNNQETVRLIWIHISFQQNYFMLKNPYKLTFLTTRFLLHRRFLNHFLVTIWYSY